MVHRTQKQKRLLRSATVKKIHMPVKIPTMDERFPRFEEEYEKSKNYQVIKRNQEVDKGLVKILNTPFSHSKITPSKDYYTYINYLWLKEQQANDTKTSVKKFYSQIDEFRTVQEKVYNEVINLIKQYKKNNHTKREAIECCNVFNSFLHLNTKYTQKHIDGFIQTYETYVGKGSLWGFLALINKNEVISWGSPLIWSVSPDDKNARYLKSTIRGPQFTLFDLNFYYGDEGQTPSFIKYKNSVKQKYFAYVERIFEATLGKNHGLNSKDVFDVEFQIISAFDCTDIRENPDGFYNIVKKDDALKKYNFDWVEFCKEMHIHNVPDSFVCSSLNYLKCISQTLQKEWTSQKWKSYWYYIFLRQFIRFHPKWKWIHYDFIEHELNGIQVILPNEVLAVIGTSFSFNTLISKLYISANKNDDVIQYATNMAKDLLTVFKRRLRRNNWLQPQTIRNAIAKMEHIHLIIGYPEAMREDPLLGYSPDDPWGNLLKISEWRIKQYTTLEHVERFDIPYIDWQHLKLTGKQPYIVNAFYTPTENSIYIPLAYLQKPFIDLQDRGIEYNLTRVGYTISHEMSHALDDFGSLYDWKGNLNTWTTPKDLAKLRKIKDDITRQYEAFAKRDGIIFDASVALGENMADISGLAICEEYLMDFQMKNEDIIPIKDLSYKAFFVYFAMNQRQHIYKAAIKSQLKVNPHPLDKYRTNIPLSRLQLFRNIYNIKKGDLMYWPSTSTIW